MNLHQFIFQSQHDSNTKPDSTKKKWSCKLFIKRYQIEIVYKTLPNIKHYQIQSVEYKKNNTLCLKYG